MTPEFKHYEKFNAIKSSDKIKPFVKVMDDVPNDYHKEKLPTITKGTIIQVEFGGNFGMYGIAAIDGGVIQVRIELEYLKHLQFIDPDTTTHNQS